MRSHRPGDWPASLPSVFTVTVPYHLDERLPQFDVGLPVDVAVTPDLPAGDPWHRMAVLYEEVAQVVARQQTAPLVISGDCTTSLGVLAGLQRAGHDVGIVWFDAHADFHTMDTTTSGYLGGLPLALAAGIGNLTLPQALRLEAVPERRIALVDARDTDPGEHVLLGHSSVVRTTVGDLHTGQAVAGEVYLQIDVDVCDPTEVPDLLYPAAGGPSLDDVVAAVHRIATTHRVAAVGIAATWHHSGGNTAVHRQILQRLHAAVLAKAARPARNGEDGAPDSTTAVQQPSAP